MSDKEGNSGGFIPPGAGPQGDTSPDVPGGVIAPGAAPRKLQASKIVALVVAVALSRLEELTALFERYGGNWGSGICRVASHRLFGLARGRRRISPGDRSPV